jgi:hypothetical protein
MHFPQSTVDLPFTVIAPNGHASSQSPQAMHAASSTCATYPEDATIGTPCFIIASRPPQQQEQQLQIA